MDNINKGAVAGIVFFSIVLIGFIGIQVNQSTVAILIGAAIGLVVTVPTTALIMIVGLRRNAGQVQTPPAQQSQGVPQSMSWTTYETHNHLHVVYVPAGASPFDVRMSAARQLGVTPNEAKRMIEAGAVKLLPAGSKWT